MSNIKYINRRMFLRGMGQFALSIPVLPSLLPRMAEAAAVVVPPRFMAMSSQDGVPFATDWYPSARPTTNQTLLYPAIASSFNARYNSPDHYIYWGPVTGGASGISYYFDSKFNPYASKMTFLRGLDYRYSPDGNHVGEPLLGSIANSTGNLSAFTNPFPTIDQIMAYANNFYPNGGVGYVRSLCINLHNYSTRGMSNGFSDPITQTGSVVAIPAVRDPKVLFTQLFPVAPPSSGPTPTPYVDAVIDSFRRVRDGRAISAADKQRLQAHMDMLSDLEKNLAAAAPASGPAACTSPTAPASSAGVSLTTSDVDFKAAYSVMNSLITLAFTCQRTRVASTYIHTVPGYEGNGGSDPSQSMWHWASHNIASAIADDQAKAIGIIQYIYKWISDNVVYDLVRKLDSVTDADGRTVLDNTLFQYSAAAMDHAHAHMNMPVLLFGSAGGKIKSGRYIDYQQRDATVNSVYGAPGVLFNQYLVTAMQAMGLVPNDYSMTRLGLLFGRYPTGAPGYGDWAVQPSWAYGPKNTAYYAGSTADVGNVLPFTMS